VMVTPHTANPKGEIPWLAPHPADGPKNTSIL
jgi:hypothetical protein